VKKDYPAGFGKDAGIRQVLGFLALVESRAVLNIYRNYVTYIRNCVRITIQITFNFALVKNVIKLFIKKLKL
jgi:hypothetical protein